MNSEIIICHKCKQEIDLLYSQSNENEVVSQSKCRCNKEKLINGFKPLDYFISVYKRGSYAKDQSSVSQVSKPAKTSK